MKKDNNPALLTFVLTSFRAIAIGQKYKTCLIILITAYTFQLSAQPPEYRGDISVAGMLQPRNSQGGMINVETTHGLRSRSGFFMGLGLGWNQLITEDEKISFLPLYVRIAQELKKDSVTPFISLDLGVSNGLVNYNLSGMYFSAKAGMLFRVQNRHISTGLGYLLHRFELHGKYQGIGIFVSFVF